ncbi:PREDICTED: uncharacterized protein LOC108780092 [Cyphomyrmex costatus]|uniref:uncharacterized protein LOC108780092 n=1 Tax=Cyphomyrmex costatus TaxID=456900 RepID=UPI00085237CA|nr:PREDICTED: uncharacterized protein LOC108780092 [Cyphomyrmex costatus]
MIQQNSDIVTTENKIYSLKQENQTNNNATVNELNIGDRTVDKRKVSRIDRSKGLSSFTTALMGIVFSPEEMGTCTMTGEVSNFQKKTISSNTTIASSKKQLDPVIKDAFIDLIVESSG